MEKPLYIPKLKKWKGLTVYCNRCKTDISEICRGTEKSISSCPFGDKHIFKVYVYVPGTKIRKTKKLNTRDVNEAITSAIEFEKQVKGNTPVHESFSDQNKPVKTSSENIPEMLIRAFGRYIGWLNNENVPAHRQKERSAEHILDIERAFRMFTECLHKKGYNVSIIRVQEIDDEMMGIFYDYLLNAKKFSNRTFNKYLSHCTSFLTWYSEEYNIQIPNWFEKINRKRINPHPESITKGEYESLLKAIHPEKGLKYYSVGEKTTRNLYRPWLVNGIKLALETGRRREEIISLRFNDIIEESNGISYIRVEDYKVNRIQKRITEAEKKYIFIPVTDSLRKLLTELNFEKYKETDNYVLAPEIKNSRTRVMSDMLSKGFSHYYAQLNTGRKLTFKCLRKTYITNLSIYLGGNAKAITGHSDDSVIEQHYIDKQAVVKAAKGFNVFSNESERKNELEGLRGKSQPNEKHLEVGK